MAKCYFLGRKKCCFLLSPYYKFFFRGYDKSLGSLDFYIISKNKSLRVAKVSAKYKLKNFSGSCHYYFDWRLE